MDLILGFVALLLVPLAAFLLVGFFAPASKKNPHVIRNDASVKVSMDAEEMEARWKAAEEFYSVNAKTIFKQAFAQQDSVLVEHLRAWSTQSLRNAKSKLRDLDTVIVEDKAAGQFASYRDRIDILARQADADLEKLKSLDVLGREIR